MENEIEVYIDNDCAGIELKTGAEVGRVSVSYTHLERTRPEALAIEKLFYQHNQTTVIGVAEASAVILLAAAQTDLPIYEYTPMQVKQAVTCLLYTSRCV